MSNASRDALVAMLSRLKNDLTGVNVSKPDIARAALQAKYPLTGDYMVEVRRLCQRGIEEGWLSAQAMANLLDNAVKYTPAGGSIRLQTRRNGGGEIELLVADTGPGIPVADRERAVERFVRLEQSRSLPGSGLGLSLAAAVAEAHSGRLVLADGDGAAGTPGLAAILVLPAA